MVPCLFNKEPLGKLDFYLFTSMIEAIQKAALKASRNSAEKVQVTKSIFFTFKMGIGELLVKAFPNSLLVRARFW